MIEKKINVASYDVYPNSTLKPSALQRYMQQLAREDCDNLGCTYIDMRRVNMVFVMTKLAIEVFKPVFAYDDIVIKTFNNTSGGITFEREFEIFKNGIKVIHATTQWCIVNYDSRRIVRTRDFPFNIPPYNLDCGSLPLPREVVAKDAAEAEERKIRLSDLDENNHLNNCVYPDIAMDILDYDVEKEYVKSVFVIFKQEARLGDVLSLSVGKTEKGFGVFAYNKTGEKPCFDADIGLAEINS